MKIVRTESNAHWYDKEGKPFHTIIGKNGKERNTTVKDARALDLLPSVTTVLSVLAKPQLEAWKQEQAILASLTLPRIEGETDDDFAKRVVIDAKQISKDAMELGSKIHSGIEGFLMGVTVEQDIYPYVKPAIDWLETNVDLSKEIEIEKRLANVELGFAGRTDLICYLKDGRKAMIDWKSKGTKEQYGHKISFWDEECWQLGAYNIIVKADTCINIGISTGKAGVIDAKEWTKEEIEKGQLIFKRCLEVFKIIKGL